jgi:hypothetical protein
MASQPTPSPQAANLDRYVVIHVATTCDEHGVYVTKDSAEVIELGWILLDAKSCEEVSLPIQLQLQAQLLTYLTSSIESLFSSSPLTRQLRRCAVSFCLHLRATSADQHLPQLA